MKYEEKIDFIELTKGLLIVFSYFLGTRLLSALFLNLLEKGIINDTTKMRTFLSFLIYLIMAIIYFLIYIKGLKKDWQKFKKNFKKNIHHGFNYWLKGMFIMMASNIIIVVLFKMGNSVNEQTNIELIKKSMLLEIPLTVLIAPFIEEIVFRMSFYKISKNKHIYALTTGLIFGFVHIISSLTSIKGFLYLIPYSAMGVAFGYLYKKTDTIFSSLMMHIFHNALTIALIIIAIKIGVY